MIDILKAQEFNEKIPAGLPPGTQVAHKTGDITGIPTTTAIVFPPVDNRTSWWSSPPVFRTRRKRQGDRGHFAGPSGRSAAHTVAEPLYPSFGPTQRVGETPIPVVEAVK